MNVDQVRKYCLAFPEATENLQWGDDLCFKVRGKIFTILTLDRRGLCFKCTPEIFSELIERENIAPAPYVGRYSWVVLHRQDALSSEELRQMIRQSYEMVESKAPKPRTSKSAVPKSKATRTVSKTGRAKRAKPRTNQDRTKKK